MDTSSKVKIKILPTGVPGLDQILGGGLPEYSFNIVGGSPGSGKTTFAHQFLFANATEERPGLYFTVLGEPTLKMLRYQQQYSFFDAAKLERAVRFVNLGQVLFERGLKGALEEITKHVEDCNPGIVVVDSFRTVLRSAEDETEMVVASFVQKLGMMLTSWEATTFLVGEYTEADMRENAVFTVADGLFWLSQKVDSDSVVRKLQVVKMRGQSSVPGLHTFRITNAGIEAFARTVGLTRGKRLAPTTKRLSVGVAALDEMLGGGIPEGDSLLISGPPGIGKSMLALQFLVAGIEAGEPGIAAVFEGRPESFVSRGTRLGIDVDAVIEDGRLNVIYLRPLDLSIDEAMQEILLAIERTGAKRLVIDSLAGFEMALAPGFRANFSESLYRMIYSLTGLGVTVVSTLEIEESYHELLFSHRSISFLTDDVIRMRYVEIGGQLRRIILVVKMRGGAHSNDIREFEITSKGVEVRATLPAYEHLTSGLPRRVNRPGNRGETMHEDKG